MVSGRFHALVKDARFFRSEMLRPGTTEDERLKAQERLDALIKEMKKLRKEMRGERSYV